MGSLIEKVARGTAIGSYHYLEHRSPDSRRPCEQKAINLKRRYWESQFCGIHRPLPPKEGWITKESPASFIRTRELCLENQVPPQLISAYHSGRALPAVLRSLVTGGENGAQSNNATEKHSFNSCKHYRKIFFFS